MLEENEDSYVQSYIQTRSIGIETLLTLQLLERGEHGGHTVYNGTTAEGGN